MITEDFTFPSATGVCNIDASCYKPDGDAEYVLIIHHGMAEHRERYKAFIEYLTSNGIAVFMHDMANHGKSNQNKALTGYFGEQNGYKNLVKDLKTMFDRARSAYPDKKIIMMGHSMGSFITRCFTAWYGNAGFDAAIYMGTGGANPIAGVGDKLSALVSKIKGASYKSKTIDKLTFGSYNDKFEKRTNFDWLTRDNSIVDKYIADEYCGFLFSVQGMNDLVKLNIEANTEQWYNSVPKNIPILLTSGDMDPVGGFGKGIKEINEKLLATGHGKTKMLLYPQCRHEILNEINKDEVYKDILDFIKSV